MSPDQSLIILSSRFEIETFKLNYTLYKRIEFMKEIKQFKVFQVEKLLVFCVEFKDGSIEYYSLQVQKTVTNFNDKVMAKKIPISGNPIVDCLHHMLSKFGLDFSFLTEADIPRKLKILVPTH